MEGHEKSIEKLLKRKRQYEYELSKDILWTEAMILRENIEALEFSINILKKE